MKKAALIALSVMLGIAAPAFAATSVEQAQDVTDDANAIRKDDAAVAEHHANIAKHRAKKAKHKANGDVGGQAVDSVKIGANKAAISEKKTEKDVDQKILNHDLNKDTSPND